LKTLVVYFSRTGHTRQIAEEIALGCGADVEEIRETQGRGGVMGYLRSGWEALRRAVVPIAPSIRDPSHYDLVIIGTPIWNFGLSPPVRAYAQRHSAAFRRVAFFCTEGGAGDSRAFEELRRICGKVPVSTLAVKEPELAEPVHRQPLLGFVQRLTAG
jgi:flavodoxin